LDETSILTRSPSVSFETVGGEAVLIQTDSGDFFSLSRVGLEFWSLLDGSGSITQHGRKIAEKYGVDPDEVITDLLDLAANMLENNLLEERRPQDLL
jgi:hypothetical protein